MNALLFLVELLPNLYCKLSFPVGSKFLCRHWYEGGAQVRGSVLCRVWCSEECGACKWRVWGQRSPWQRSRRMKKTWCPVCVIFLVGRVFIGGSTSVYSNNVVNMDLLLSPNFFISTSNICCNHSFTKDFLKQSYEFRYVFISFYVAVLLPCELC